jgi:endothelin-converting enzyme/putative endopeptidase
MRRATFLRLSAAVAIAALTVPGIAKVATKTGPRYGSFGIDLTAQQRTLKPGDDFWTYANGNWDKRTQIAPDRTSAGYGVVLSDEAEQQVRAIVADLAADPKAYGASGQQIGDLYASWMDEAATEARGTAPLQPYLAKIAAVNDKAALQVLFASVGYASPVELGQLPNPTDPTRYVAAASQGGLGMGGRDYYLLEGAKYDAFRKAYRDYVIEMQTLAGIPDAATKADAIIALETAMAKEQWSPERQRNLMEMFRPMDRAGMKKLAPEFDWDLMLKTAGLDSIPTVIMATSTALTANGKMLDSVPLAT